MVDKALFLITSQLNQYIQPLGGGDEVVLGNIALNEASDQTEIKDKVVVTLVNIEEEATLKNVNNTVKQNSKIQYLHPPVFLNLYVLFCANYPTSYSTALTRLSSVLTFFQTRKSFSLNNAQPIPDSFDPGNPDDVELAINLDIFTITFEQLNHLWGALGGKQMPFVMYKVRLVKIQDRNIYKEAPLIEEIVQNFQTAKN